VVFTNCKLTRNSWSRRSKFARFLVWKRHFWFASKYNYRPSHHNFNL